MSSFAVSPSKPVNLNVTELRRLFWAGRVMEAFRQGHGTMFNVPTGIDHTRLANWLFGDDALFDPEVYRDTVVFTFVGNWYGNQLWVAVTCGEEVIVPPFLLEGKWSDLPYFSEELSACSTSR